MLIQLTVNQKKHAVEVDPADVLLDVLRNLGYKSVQRGCDTSNCGLCSVLADGEPILSCSTLAWQAEGKRIQTIEGLHDEVEQVASCLAGEGSDQCGYCSPGLILSTIALKNKLLTRSADAVQTVSDDEINSFLLGNLCRCTGYVGQLRAIRRYLAGRDAQPADTVAINPAPHKSLAHAADLHGKLRGTSVGKAVEKLDSRSILHGKAVYTDDLAAPDALVIKILRSPHAHARIRSIDTSKAHKGTRSRTDPDLGGRAPDPFHAGRPVLPRTIPL